MPKAAPGHTPRLTDPRLAAPRLAAPRLAGPRLAAVDLNLLVAFDALMAEQNVTRAAARVGLSQPAMSHALDRLRKLLDDPLLVRAPGGADRSMLPTPRAQELLRPIRDALNGITHALSERHAVNPQALHRSFVIACSDEAAVTLVPTLVTKFTSIAPDARLSVRPLDDGTIERQLATGEVDVGIGRLAGVKGRALLQQLLFRDRGVLMCRRGHAAASASYTLDVTALAALEHADAPLLAAPAIVARSNLVFITSARVVDVFAAMLAVQAVELPRAAREAREQYGVGSFWHERQTRDPEHTWFRQMIVEVVR